MNLFDVRILSGYVKMTFDNDLKPVYHFNNGTTIVAASRPIPNTKEKVHGFLVNGEEFCETVDTLKEFMNTLETA